MTPEMLDSPESYMLVVVCNESVFVEKMAAEIHLDDSNLRTLSLEAPEGSELSAAEIGSIDVDDDSHLIVNIPLPAEGSIKLAPCKCFVYFTGTVNGIDIDTFAVVDVAQGDQALDISDFVRTFAFQIAGGDEQQFSAQLLAYYSEPDAWRLLPMDYAFDATTGLLSCCVDSPVQIADLDEADAAYMLVYASNKAFLVQVLGDDGSGQHIDLSGQKTPVALDCADLNRVTFASASDDWTVQQAAAQWNGYVLPLSGNEFFLSDGTYDFSVTYESNGVPLVSNMTRNVAEDCVLSVDEAASELRDVTVSWSDAFSQVGAASARSDTGFSVSDQEFTSGGSLLVEEGPQEVELKLWCGDCAFNVDSNLTVGAGANAVSIGNEFTGDLEYFGDEEPYTGDRLEFWILNPADERGNMLKTVEVADHPLKATVTFTDVDDAQRVFTAEFSTDNHWGMYVPAPEEPGTYRVSAEVVCDGLCAADAFSDIDSGQWYHEAVDWAFANKVMNGYGDGTFGPNDVLYREQAATVLYNYLGEGDTSAPAAPLSDVDQAAWYATSLNWVFGNGIMNGYDGSDRFGVGDALTREQFCAVIANAVDANTADADLSVLDAFPDAAEVSSWARPSVAWAVERGLLNGVEQVGGTRALSATRDITRAEMATMMSNAVDAGVLAK